MSANVVDSSGWLEYLVDGPRARTFAPAIEDAENLLVPVVCVFEVVRKAFRDRGDAAALAVAATMRTGTSIEVDLDLVLEAARLNLPFADSLIYAIAQRHGATLWTQDEHFKDLPGVRYFPKK